MKNHLFDSDSTELLLDAMCNVFGVVLLIAIIIGGVTVSNKITDPGMVRVETFKQAEQSAALQSSRLKAARARRDFLQSLHHNRKTALPPEAIDRALEQAHRQLVDKVNAQADRIEALHSQLAAEKALTWRLQNSSIKQERALIAQYQSALQNAQNSQAMLYGVAAAGKLTPWRILADKEKFYVIGSNAEIYRGSDRDSQVDIRSFKQGKHRFFRIVKRANKGMLLKELSLEKMGITPADSSKYFVEILSEPDAVAAAALLVKTLRQNNIYFAWRTVPANGAVLRTSERGNYEISR